MRVKKDVVFGTFLNLKPSAAFPHNVVSMGDFLTKDVEVFLYDGWFINTLFFLLYHTLADRQT